MNKEITTKPITRVEFKMSGEFAKMFLDYKEKEHLRNNTQTAYKLIVERLEQLQTKKEIQNNDK